MHSFQLMMDAGRYLPAHIGPWITWMQVVLFLLPFLFIKYLAPRYLILAQLLNTLTAYLVFVGEGHQVTKLFGIGHFFWILPLWLLARDARNAELSLLYRGYAGIAVLTMSISLVFDTKDTAQWMLGDRRSVLVGVPADSALAKPTNSRT